MFLRFNFLALAALVLPLGACASLSPEAPFTDVAHVVEERSGERIVWDPDTSNDSAETAAIEELLEKRLTARRAIQIALLNNRTLRAKYAELGIAQAELVQAALPPNPIADGTVTFTGDGATNLIFGGAMSVIEILRIPLKRRVARSQLETVKLKIANDVMQLAGTAYSAFIQHQADLERIGLLRQVLVSAKASLTTAEELRRAGNITSLALESQKTEFHRQTLSLERAQISVVRSREQLNRVMGLIGNHRVWSAVHRVPDVSDQNISSQTVERRALDASLDLAAARQKLETLGARYRLTNSQSLVPKFSAGGEWERDGGAAEAGPRFALALPLLDWGQARKAKAKMEIAQARDAYVALAVDVRSAARLNLAELTEARKRAVYFRSTVIPQSQRVLDHTQRQYNAMQLGVFQLIQAKRAQIQTGLAFVEAKAAYWRAHANLAQLLAGAMPAENATATARN